MIKHLFNKKTFIWYLFIEMAYYNHAVRIFQDCPEYQSFAYHFIDKAGFRLYIVGVRVKSKCCMAIFNKNQDVTPF
jgi:hypothetical protein